MKQNERKTKDIEQVRRYAVTVKCELTPPSPHWAFMVFMLTTDVCMDDSVLALIPVIYISQHATDASSQAAVLLFSVKCELTPPLLPPLTIPHVVLPRKVVYRQCMTDYADIKKNIIPPVIYNSQHAICILFAMLFIFREM